jgi:hypothetical protein
VINLLSSRPLGKFSTIRDSIKLADEFDIGVKVVYYNSQTTRSSKVSPNRHSGNNSKRIPINVQKFHYFIAELTPFYDADFDLNPRYNPGKPIQLTSVHLLMTF